MGYIQPIRDWRTPIAVTPAYERLLATMGTEEFGGAARAAVISVTASIRRLYLFEVQGRASADLQYFSGEAGLGDLIPVYLKCYLPLDPVHEAFRAAPGRNDMALQRVRPAEIAPACFRRKFFDDAGIVERVSIVQCGADSWRVMNVARHERDGCFSDVEIDALVGLACLILPMLTVSRGNTGLSRRLSVEEFEDRFARRCPALTGRERQVCARAAIGMTVEATALDLGVAKTSVLTYRQRAYQRLGITSPFELSALVGH